LVDFDEHAGVAAEGFAGSGFEDLGMMLGQPVAGELVGGSDTQVITVHGRQPTGSEPGIQG
jgi:hypothetical protein